MLPSVRAMIPFSAPASTMPLLPVPKVPRARFAQARRVACVLAACAVATAGAAATLVWEPGPASVEGYRVHVGIATGNYEYSVDVGLRTSWPLPALSAGRAHVFAVTAYDASGRESAFSNEVELTREAGDAVPLSASFTASPVSGSAPLAVRLTPTASGAVLWHRWELGDGSQYVSESALPLPVLDHTFELPGTYSVTLTVAGPQGIRSSRADAAIRVADAGSADPCPCTLWDDRAPNVPDDGRDGPVNVGMRFRTLRDGWITAIRFYKSPANLGPHHGELWTAAGRRLGGATFTDETPSGWQQATLDAPIPVSAHADYIVSYHAPEGRVAHDAGMFLKDVVHGPLVAPAHRVAGGQRRPCARSRLDVSFPRRQAGQLLGGCRVRAGGLKVRRSSSRTAGAGDEQASVRGAAATPRRAWARAERARAAARAASAGRGRRTASRKSVGRSLAAAASARGGCERATAARRRPRRASSARSGSRRACLPRRRAAPRPATIRPRTTPGRACGCVRRERNLRLRPSRSNSIAGKVVRQAEADARADHGERVRGVQREEPDAGHIAVADVGAEIELELIADPRQCGKQRRAHARDPEGGDPDPRPIIEHLEVESGWQQRSHEARLDGPVQEHEVAPALVQDRGAVRTRMGEAAFGHERTPGRADTATRCRAALELTAGSARHQ